MLLGGGEKLGPTFARSGRTWGAPTSENSTGLREGGEERHTSRTAPLNSKGAAPRRTLRTQTDPRWPFALVGARFAPLRCCGTDDALGFASDGNGKSRSLGRCCDFRDDSAKQRRGSRKPGTPSERQARGNSYHELLLGGTLAGSGSLVRKFVSAAATGYTARVGGSLLTFFSGSPLHRALQFFIPGNAEEMPCPITTQVPISGSLTGTPA